MDPALPLRFLIQNIQNAVRPLRMKFLCHSVVGKIFHICIDDFIFPVDHTGAVIAVAYPCIINKIPVPEPFQHLFRLVEFRRRPGRFIILCGGVLHRLIRPVSVDRSVDLYLQFSAADLIVKFIEIEILFSSVFLYTDEDVFRIFVQPSAFGPLFQVAGAVGQSGGIFMAYGISQEHFLKIDHSLAVSRKIRVPDRVQYGIGTFEHLIRKAPGLRIAFAVKGIYPHGTDPDHSSRAHCRSRHRHDPKRRQYPFCPFISVPPFLHHHLPLSVRSLYSFSTLYPRPQTTFRYLGSLGLISIFSRIWRIWTATVLSAANASSFQIFS